MTGLKWTRKTSRKLSRELKRRSYRVGPDTVRRLLRDRKYRLRANRKRLNKKRDPERDRQMCYVVCQRRAFQRAGFPVISLARSTPPQPHCQANKPAMRRRLFSSSDTNTRLMARCSLAVLLRGCARQVIQVQ